MILYIASASFPLYKLISLHIVSSLCVQSGLGYSVSGVTAEEMVIPALDCFGIISSDRNVWRVLDSRGAFLKVQLIA